MNRVYDALKHNTGKIIFFVAIGVAATFAISRLLSPSPSEVSALQATPTPYPEQSWQINQSLTIGDFTMELIAVTDTADGLRVSQSYRTSVSELNYLPIYESQIRYSDGSISDAHGARLPSPGEDVNMSLGAFIVADTSLTGSVEIPLASVSEDGTLSPQPELSIGNRKYAIISLVLQQEQLNITVQPRNEAAERSTLGVAADAPVEAILTDDTGNSYTNLWGSMEFEPFSQTLVSQEIVFDGGQEGRLSSVTKFTLTIRGGGNIVGPFVFENVGLVSEDIPPVTPVPPGGVGPGDPVPTPPNVNN